jgi:hypothetical protein
MAATVRDIKALVKAGRTGPRRKAEEVPPPPGPKNVELATQFMRRYRAKEDVDPPPGKPP